MYILCFDQKSLLKVKVETLQRDPKGVISKFGIAFWSQVYVYILSMGKGCVFVVNTYSFFCAATGLSMDRDWRGSRSRSPRDRIAIVRARPAITVEDERRVYTRQSFYTACLVRRSHPPPHIHHTLDGCE